MFFFNPIPLLSSPPRYQPRVLVFHCFPVLDPGKSPTAPTPIPTEPDNHHFGLDPKKKHKNTMGTYELWEYEQCMLNGNGFWELNLQLEDRLGLIPWMTQTSNGWNPTCCHWPLPHPDRASVTISWTCGLDVFTVGDWHFQLNIVIHHQQCYKIIHNWQASVMYAVNCC